jgi:hypothetical protein
MSGGWAPPSFPGRCLTSLGQGQHRVVRDHPAAVFASSHVGDKMYERPRRGPHLPVPHHPSHPSPTKLPPLLVDTDAVNLSGDSQCEARARRCGGTTMS